MNKKVRKWAMDKELKDKLVECGFDVDTTLQRFMGNETLYFKFLKKLPADQNYKAFIEAVEKEDLKAAFRSGHTLKGVMSNLGVDGALKALVPMVEKLRANETAGLQEELKEFQDRYEKAIVCIESL